MAFELGAFADIGLSEELLTVLLAEHEAVASPGLSRLWDYYRNPRRDRLGTGSPSDRGYRLAQEAGLPARLRGGAGAGLGAGIMRDDRNANAEVVIENDIAWRVDAMVDFVFGKPVTILSTARDEELRTRIERVLDAVWENSGGIQLLQDMALLSGVYGFVDLVVRAEGVFEGEAAAGEPTSDADAVVARAASVRIELVEAPRAVPVLDPGDYRRLDGYIIRSRQVKNQVVGEAGADPSRGDPSAAPRGGGSFAARIGAMLGARRLTPPAAGTASARAPGSGRRITEVIEVLSANHRQVYDDAILIVDEPLRMGELPVVHIQNASQPFNYAGVSDVESLVSLQDELNTRLSDRAHRVTLQSFNMYLAKGLEGFGAGAVGPGQVWSTDNPVASIEAFGGDAHAPSEAAHIEEIRDAMDKASAVSPVALGVIRAKLGHLSSENALRITLNGVLSKTARKRVTFGRGIAEASRLVLKALDEAGVLKTGESDRGIRLHWQDPLPLDERARLTAGQIKRDLGVPQQQVLAELGYARVDAGVG